MTRETISMIATGIIFVGMGFAAGYTVSELLGKDAVAPVEAVLTVQTAAPITDTPTPEPTATVEYYGVHYIIAAQNDVLILYEADGDSKKILRKSKINVNSFPSSDITELKNGITTGTLEGALEIWEGFSE